MRYLLAVLALLGWVGSSAAQPCGSYIVNSTGGIVCSTDGLGNSLFGTLKTAHVHLSSAQILALNTTPITLVAAPGTGKTILPIMGLVRLNFSTVAYATNTQTSIGWGTTATAIHAANFGNTDISVTASADAQLSAGLQATSPIFDNLPIGIAVVPGNPTAGDSTIDIWLSYVVQITL